jgi:hypothetical protein
MDNDKFIFASSQFPMQNQYRSIPKPRANCFEQQGLTSIYRTCDAIEGLEEGLNALRYDDHNFKDYEVFTVMAEETLFASMITTLEEMAELLKETDR